MANRRSILTAGGALIAGGLCMVAGRPGGSLFGAGPALADTTAPAGSRLPNIPDMTLGNPSARVHVIEYASFTCPHCRDFHAEVWPQLKRHYVDTGKVRFTIRGYYRNGFDVLADAMALCGGPMRYFGIVDALFNTQDVWMNASNLDQAAANLRQIGRDAGMTDAKMKECMSDRQMEQAMIDKVQKDATADHVKGTPTFVIDGTTYGNMGYQDFAKILDAELAKQS